MLNTRNVNRPTLIQSVVAMLATLAVVTALPTAILAELPLTDNRLEQEFANPPTTWKSRPLWFWT